MESRLPFLLCAVTASGPESVAGRIDQWGSIAGVRLSVRIPAWQSTTRGHHG